MRTARRRLGLVVSLSLSLACGNKGESDDARPEGARDGAADAAARDGAPADVGRDAGGVQKQPSDTPVNVSLPAARQAALSTLQAKVDAQQSLDAQAVRAVYPTRFSGPPSYDPTTAEFFAKIQASPLALSPSELTAFRQNGFVISKTREFPSFARGYAELYSEHLPVYVSADALLEAVHRSYDAILLEVELRALIPALEELLTSVRSQLSTVEADAETRADLDLYLASALSLLRGEQVPLVAGASSSELALILKRANDATGLASLRLFGTLRDEDFSQFKPRGHYEGDLQLERYFRAMMWLGRIDFRLLETLTSGETVFRPKQFRAMVLLHELAAAKLETFTLIDDTVRTFVGESDYMVLSQVPQLLADLGGPAQARTASEQQIAQAILDGGYGQQQIASHIVFSGEGAQPMPLNRSFALLGQRYVVDSHVFSQLVHDRVAYRMMPNPLDAAFAALGNAQALALHPELQQEPAGKLPGALASTRLLVDSHGDDFWGKNFYNLWLSALRALSPRADLSDPGALGLPQIAGTEAWGKRLLNTQLASWAELRHDTLLYAKQSYTGIPVCNYPAAYVDPYPAFYEALLRYAERGAQLGERLTLAQPALTERITQHFVALREASGRLLEMAQRELRGEEFTAEQLAWINDAVRIERQSLGCTSVDYPDGWYGDLFFDKTESVEFAPTIADVHTQPADAAGNIVGKVLHVGTGFPRLMVATIDSCNGNPRAYAGVVFAYHEQTTERFQRLTDAEWELRFRNAAERPAEVPWLSSVLE